LKAEEMIMCCVVWTIEHLVRTVKQRDLNKLEEFPNPVVFNLLYAWHRWYAKTYYGVHENLTGYVKLKKIVS
jgi:hypothetical protein